MIQDAVVLNSTRLLVLYKNWATLGVDHYYATVISDANTAVVPETNFGANTVNDNLALSYYNSTHFLYSRQTSSARFVKLSTFAGSAESVAWTASVWNEQGNNGFTITDVNKDGSNDVIAIFGSNLGLLNGKTGSTIYNIGEVFSSNVTSVAIVDDLDGDGIKEVVVRADKSYLISFKPTTYNIIWQQNFGSEGLSAIQDIDGDGYKDVVAATGAILSAFVGSGVKVSTPIFAPPGGTYSSAQSVVLSCATSGVIIRYTTDSAEPTSSSTAYSAPISVNSNITIKAKAFLSGITDSDTASATYTINPPPPLVSIPTFNPVAGTYNSAQNVAIQCSTSGATIRFTIDGSEPSSSSTVYSSSVPVTSTTTIKAKAFMTEMGDSSTASAIFTITATPTPTPTNPPTTTPTSPTTTPPPQGSIVDNWVLYMAVATVTAIAIVGGVLYLRRGKKVVSS